MSIMAGMKNGGSGFLVVFALFWSAIVLVFDGILVRSIWWQTIGVAGYQPTPATVLESRVDSSTDSDGDTTYRPKIRYAYEVDGRRYESDRTTYYAMQGSSDKTLAEDWVKRYPAGAAREAFVDPANPAEAVLKKGLGNGEAFMALFLVPFNAIMLGLWGAVISFWRYRAARPEAGGYPVERTGMKVTVDLGYANPCWIFLAAAGATGFVAIFIVGFGFGFGNDPAAGAGLILAAMAGIAGFMWQAHRNATRPQALVIDRPVGEMVLPPTQKRKESLRVPLSVIRWVDVTVTKKSDSDGTTYTYGVDMEAWGRIERLAELYDEKAARDFAEWIRRETGATVRPASPGASTAA